MTRSSPAATNHWAISTRTQGGVLSAGAALPSIELVLLGIPGGFTPVEIQSWLRDLASVALETSRTDERSRPIPQLLHHALTGLLFSQTELWSQTGQSLPCAAVFVEGAHGVAFGWVGRARVVLLVNGEPHEPQWVIVRDEAGQEAMSAMLPTDAHVLLTLEHWPGGEDGTQSPASLDAEWGQSPSSRSAAQAMEAAPAPAPKFAVGPEPDEARTPGEPPAAASAATLEIQPGFPSPVEGLPTDQPGLAPDPTKVALDRPDNSQSLPSTFHASSGTFAMPTVPGLDAGAAAPSAGRASEPSPSGLPHERIAPGAAEPEHPVGRWLARLMSFGQKPTPDPSARERIEPGIASAPAPAAQATPAPKPSPTSAPPPARTAPPALGPLRAHEFQIEPSSAPPDIEASHALPSTGSLHAAPTGPPTRPQVAPNASRIGLAAAGLHEILGAKGGAKATPSARPAGLPRVAGLTAVSAASGPLEPPARASVTPESLTPGEPPYPTLDVTPIAPPARGSFHIEREPVGADTTFAIPRLPPRDAPRPVRVAVPTAADTPRREPVSPPVAPAPATAPPPVAAVPEPPVDFLAEFAASVGGVPTDSTPTPPPPPPAAVATPMRRAGDRAPQAPNSTAPPLLPSVLRAAAVTAPATPLPVPTVVPPPAQGLPPSRPAPFAITPSVSEPLPVAPFGSPVLRAPTLAEPMAVAASEVAAQMRELSLPASDEPATDDVPDGMLVTTPSAAIGRGFRSRRGPWPGPEELEPAGTPPWRQPWVIGTFVTVLFGVGWFVGHSQAPDNDIHATPMSRVLRSVGLGGARFTAIVDTDPPGAFISVDGKPVSRRTPSTIELMPGVHTLTLSMPDLGEVEVPVKGSRGQKVKVNEGLHGVLEVSALDPALPVKMSLDGEPKGFLPVRVDRLPPGLHEVQFSGPSMQTWGQTVNIGIRQTTTLKTRPVVSPATGVVQVQASLNDENGTAPLTGAAVYVDGEMRGSTPLTLELPRGPHSLRVFYGGETAPVQVIDLPGGNRRFAAFQFGLDSDLPPLRLLANYSQLSNQRSTLVEGSLAGLDWHDLREAWLHVRSGEGLWRRYQMTISEGPQGALLSVNFPTQMFDAQGRVTWYMSAATSQGDEFYTELQRSTR